MPAPSIAETNVDNWLEQRRIYGEEAFDKLLWVLNYSGSRKAYVCSSSYGYKTPKDAKAAALRDITSEKRSIVRNLNNQMTNLERYRGFEAKVKEFIATGE
jgi:hypothetical protein